MRKERFEKKLAKLGLEIQEGITASTTSRKMAMSALGVMKMLGVMLMASISVLRVFKKLVVSTFVVRTMSLT